MKTRSASRLRALERQAPVSRPGCISCRDWRCEVLYGEEPGPPAQCSGCGRPRPADLFVVRFVAREDGPQ